MLANYFNEIGHQVIIFTAFNTVTLSCELNKCVTLTPLNLPSLKKIVSKIGKLTRDHQIDVIISNLWPLNLWVSLGLMFSETTTKVILVEHINLSVGLRLKSRFEQFAARIFHKFLIPLNTQIVAVSDGVLADLVENMGVKREQITAVHNPVLEFRSLENRTHLRRGNTGRANLLAVGNLKPQKDYATMIRAMKILHDQAFDFELVIAGEGPLRASIESDIKVFGLKDRICLLGETVSTSTLYLKADVYVLSSKWEGFGNTLVEALSYGCKVVSTDCPSGPSEILCSGTYGILVPPENPAALADAIREAFQGELNNEGLRAHCLKFSDFTIGSKYLRLCDL